MGKSRTRIIKSCLSVKDAVLKPVYSLRPLTPSGISLLRGKRIALGLLLVLGFIYPAEAGVILADFEPDSPANVQSTVSTTLASVPTVKRATIKTRTARVTAYSSSPDETDDTPFTTANGGTVRDGIVATNFLPFGTRIRIPKLFGDKTFVVTDRMHPRMKNGVDVWMDGKEKALRFGVHDAEIAILD